MNKLRVLSLSAIMSFGLVNVVTSAHAQASDPDEWKSEICGSSPSAECVASNFDELRSSANDGKAYAAKALFRWLNSCQRSPRSIEDIENAPVTVVGGNQQKAEAAARSMLNSMRISCQYFSAQQRALLPAVAWEAVKTGYPTAQSLVYAKLLTNETAYVTAPQALTAEQFVAAVKASAKSGSTLSMELLTRIYSDGKIAIADPVTANAYQLAFDQRMVQRYGKSTSRNPQLKTLSDDELNRAKELSTQIVPPLAK